MLAAALRLVGIRYGLPLSVLNPDESNIVPRAWRMGHGHLDPGWYDYPSLLMAVLAPVQALFGGPSFGAARFVAVAVGLGGVGATWWLGRRAYGTGAAIVGAAAVAVATTHVAYSRMAVTDVLLTLAVTCVLALAVSGRIEWAGLAVGLAASAKYPGAIAAVPVVVAGWGRWRALGRAGGARDRRVRAHEPVRAHPRRMPPGTTSRACSASPARAGSASRTTRSHRSRISTGSGTRVGPLLLVAAVGVVAALIRRTRTDLILLSFAVAYWLTLMPQQAHFERYILPLVPVLAVLAGSVRVAVPFALVALALPLAWSVSDARELTRTDTRLRADAWVAANVPRGDTIAADPSTLPLTGRRVVRLELPGPGRPSDPERDLARLRREGVKWVIVSGDVTDRVLAASGPLSRARRRSTSSSAHGAKPAFVVLPERAWTGRAVGPGLPALTATVAR